MIQRPPVRTVLLLTIVTGCLGAAGPRAADLEGYAAEIYGQLVEGRSGTAAELVRDARLDAVAKSRAELVAGLPHNERLQVEEPIGDRLREAGIRFHRVTTHLDLQRGYRNPPNAFVKNWKKHEAWQTAMDPSYGTVGLAVARGDDKWLVLVAVFLEDVPPIPDLVALEAQVLQVINEIRRKRELPPLVSSGALAVIARSHSEDMARRSYFGHRTPEGDEPGDRVEAGGEYYSRVAENIYRGRGVVDPASAAVEGWMMSAGHRKNILSEEFAETGIGVAADEDGMIYFTQLFLSR